MLNVIREQITPAPQQINRCHTMSSPWCCKAAERLAPTRPGSMRACTRLAFGRTG